MKKIFKAVVLVVSMLTMLAISGCGGDKFSGKWINTNPVFGEGYRVKELVIEKNGQSYIIKQNLGRYDESHKMLNEKEYNKSFGWYYFGDSKKNKEVIPEYDYTYTWQMGPVSQGTAVEKSGRLVIDGAMGMDAIAYVEKDGTLLWNQLVFKKENKDDIAKYKQSEQKRLPKAIREEQKSSKINKVEFVDAPINVKK